MKATVDLDTTNFDNMLVELSKMTGKSLQDVIKGEAAAIIGMTMMETNLADPKKIDARYTYTEHGENKKTVKEILVNGKITNVRSVKKYGVWVETKKKRYWDPKKLNPKWRPLQKALKFAKERAKRMKGLSKATWFEIAYQLKMTHQISPKKAVTVTMKKAWQNMKGTRVMGVLSGTEKGEAHYTLTMKNFSDKALTPGANGFIAFTKAWGGRIKFFEENLTRGVFNSVKNTARKYPGMSVTEIED
jgi:hypothetical protein